MLRQASYLGPNRLESGPGNWSSAQKFRGGAGDVGYVPFAMGHYVENTESTTLRFLEMFKSSYYADLALDQWLAPTPPELLKAHLNLDQQVTDASIIPRDRSFLRKYDLLRSARRLASLSIADSSTRALRRPAESQLRRNACKRHRLPGPGMNSSSCES
jgi:hypothetical protein